MSRPHSPGLGHGGGPPPPPSPLAHSPPPRHGGPHSYPAAAGAPPLLLPRLDFGDALRRRLVSLARERFWPPFRPVDGPAPALLRRGDGSLEAAWALAQEAVERVR